MFVISGWRQSRKEREKKPEWLDFLFVVPGGICGKKQGFHINDDRVVAALKMIKSH